MRLAREGWREMLVATVLCGGLAVVAWWASAPLAALPVLLWVWVISFFRDPARPARFAPGELCAPADGKVTEITELDHHDLFGGPARRVGIFLSIFNVHINRTPCAGRVRTVAYQPGRFLDARHPASGAGNESNTLLLEADAPVHGPVIVRQVAGLLARRIVCHLSPGDTFAAGQRFGMIKFGSRTELIVPMTPGAEVAVRVGQQVRAGETVLVRGQLGHDGSPESAPSSADATAQSLAKA